MFLFCLQLLYLDSMFLFHSILFSYLLYFPFSFCLYWLYFASLYCFYFASILFFFCSCLTFPLLRLPFYPFSHSLLDAKRKEVGDAANKLRNGLDKLIDTRQKVEAMTVELEETKAQLAIFQKQCEEYLVVIVQQKRDAEEQEKSVATRSEKIAVEEARCQVCSYAVTHLN